MSPPIRNRSCSNSSRPWCPGKEIRQLLTELVIALVVRTRHVFWRSKPGKYLLLTSLAFIVITLAIPYIPFITVFGFIPLPAPLMLTMIGLTILYMAVVEIAKKYFYSRGNNATA